MDHPQIDMKSQSHPRESDHKKKKEVGTAEPTHSVASVPVGHQHAEEDEHHEDTLHHQHTGPQQPGLLHSAGAAVLAAAAARPARKANGHAGVTPCSAVTPIGSAAICGKQNNKSVKTCD